MINKLKEIFNKPFPVDECTRVDEENNYVFNSTKEHYVLFQYRDGSDDYYEIRKLFPYVYIEDNDKYYGWFDKINIFSNKENQVHAYDNLVAIGND